MTKKATPRLLKKQGKKASKRVSPLVEIRVALELEIKRLLPLAKAGRVEECEALIELLSEQGKNYLRFKWKQPDKWNKRQFFDGAEEYFFREIRPIARNTRFDYWLGEVKMEGNVLAQFNTAFLNSANDFHKGLHLLRASNSSQKMVPTKAQAIALTGSIDTEFSHDNGVSNARMNNKPLVDGEIFELEDEDFTEAASTFSAFPIQSSSSGKLLLRLNCEPENAYWRTILRKCHWQHAQALATLLRERYCQPFNTFVEYPALLRYRHWHGVKN